MSQLAGYVERINLSHIEEGDTVQITGIINGKLSTLELDIFRQSEGYSYTHGFATQQIGHENTEAGFHRVADLNLSKRWYRLPLSGVIEPGDLMIDSLSKAVPWIGPVERYPDDLWSPMPIGCVVLELFTTDD